MGGIEAGWELGVGRESCSAMGRGWTDYERCQHCHGAGLHLARSGEDVLAAGEIGSGLLGVIGRHPGCDSKPMPRASRPRPPTFGTSPIGRGGPERRTPWRATRTRSSAACCSLFCRAAPTASAITVCGSAGQRQSKANIKRTGELPGGSGVEGPLAARRASPREAPLSQAGGSRQIGVNRSAAVPASAPFRGSCVVFRVGFLE